LTGTVLYVAANDQLPYQGGPVVRLWMANFVKNSPFCSTDSKISPQLGELWGMYCTHQMLHYEFKVCNCNENAHLRYTFCAHFKKKPYLYRQWNVNHIITRIQMIIWYDCVGMLQKDLRYAISSNWSHLVWDKNFAVIYCQSWWFDLNNAQK
jgi:hypothetical protein